MLSCKCSVQEFPHIVLRLFVEVHIISIENLKLDVIYLLFPQNEGDELQLPDMFSINEQITQYSSNECLTIKGSSIVYGDYRMEIIPAKVSQERGIVN